MTQVSDGPISLTSTQAHTAPHVTSHDLHTCYARVGAQREGIDNTPGKVRPEQKKKQQPPCLFDSPLSKISENANSLTDTGTPDRACRNSPRSFPSFNPGITPSDRNTCTSPAASNREEAPDARNFEQNKRNTPKTIFDDIPVVDEIQITTPTRCAADVRGAISPTTENPRAITIDTNLSRGATLRDLVYNNDEGDSAFRTTTVRDEGEGILDQPITTPTARTPVRRMSFVNFNPPRSPTGARNLHSQVNRNRPALADEDGFGVYPPMPEGHPTPCLLPALVPIRLLDIPPPQTNMTFHSPESECHLHDIPVDEGDSAVPIQPNRIFENTIFVGATLRNVELRNCHVTNCKIFDSIFKGGYCSGSIFRNCDIASAQCVVSSVFDQSFATLRIITNCHFQQGGVKESRIMDSILEFSGVFYCRLTRCSIKQCEFFDIEQIECPFHQCDPDGDIDRYFEPPKRQTNLQSKGHRSKRKSTASKSSTTTTTTTVAASAHHHHHHQPGDTNADVGDKNESAKAATDGGSEQKECVDKTQAEQIGDSPKALFEPPLARETKVGKKKFFCCA